MWILTSLIVAFFGVLLLLEYLRPLRRRVEVKLPRLARNLAVSAVGAAAVQLVEIPLIMPLSALVERREWGLLNLLQWPVWAEVILAVILMDYTLYVWHVLTHRVPLLWRFHLVHHVDLDLDASTALRFHFGELLFSVPWRAAQVIIIGVSPISFLVWQGFVFFSILFHHSNVALPVKLERWMVRLVVTPRMHGIHHSIVREETNSNWSSGLTVWDWLHGTLRLNVPQQEIIIGVPAYREQEEVTVGKILLMPFGREKPAWQLPHNGQPARPESTVAPDHLLA
ncbi:MAG: sterol desaturase family protein [Acidobacteriota bacterium]|nr:sterol desaturase family protein [Acidobacteriota bacterium]